MSAVQLTYEEALSECSEAVNELLGKLRGSNSKYKDTELSGLKWSIDYATMIEQQSLASMLSNPPRKTRQEQIDTFIKNTKSAIELKAGRWCDKVFLDEVPQRVVDAFTANLDSAERERQHFESLSAEEQQQQVAKDIDELKKMGGFAVYMFTQD